MPVEDHKAYPGWVDALDEMIDASTAAKAMARRANVSPTELLAALQRIDKAMTRLEEERERIGKLDG